jgi:succinate dehydrogenase/fumarate reductase flavoprotein subunit
MTDNNANTTVNNMKSSLLNQVKFQASDTTIPYQEFTTDILVIGGGYAGTFAAVQARDKGFEVIVADKGRVGLGGKTPWAAAYQCYDPASGESPEVTIKNTALDSDYMVRRDIVEMWVEDSLQRYRDLVAWGAIAPKDEKNQGDVFRKQLRKVGARLIEKISIVDLIKKDGRIVGAIGFYNQTTKAIVIKAKAVILCTGAGSFKTPGYPIGSLTHDGQAMAYRLGAEISGKENVDPHETKIHHMCYPWGAFGTEYQWPILPKFDSLPPRPSEDGRPPIDGGPPSDNPDYVPISADAPPPPRPPFPMIEGPDMTYAACRGDVPVTPLVVVGGKGQKGPNVLNEDVQLTLSATSGMAMHRFDGIFTKFGTHQTGIDGLFAAGDATFSAIHGLGVSSCGSSVQGARAGQEAANYIKNLDHSDISQTDISEKIQTIFAPLIRANGYSPAWVTQYLQGIMNPFFVLHAKRKETLQATLTNVEYLQKSIVPKMKANNSHELRLVHETTNMILNAEMKLRASLFRTESRGSHYREDIPARNDKEWMAWVILNQENGEMKVSKRPIPKEWQPPANLSYEQRYRTSYPGEKEYREALK